MIVDISNLVNNYERQVSKLMDHKRTQVPLHVLHAVLALNSEAGELANAYIRHLGYNEMLDIDNVYEELGDLLFFITYLANYYGGSLDRLIVANSAKLKKRYPHGYWTPKAAKERADKASAGGESSPEPASDLDHLMSFVISDLFPSIRREIENGK